MKEVALTQTMKQISTDRGGLSTGKSPAQVKNSVYKDKWSELRWEGLVGGNLNVWVRKQCSDPRQSSKAFRLANGSHEVIPSEESTSREQKDHPGPSGRQ